MKTSARAVLGPGSSHVGVVDDDASLLRSMGRLLSVAGYAVSMFPSAREFLASLPAAAPDCLVLDVQMPEMNGLELQDKLIELGYCIPVILITAHDTLQFRQRAHPIETAALLIKPFDGSALLGAVRRTLAVFTTCAGDGFEGR